MIVVVLVIEMVIISKVVLNGVRSVHTPPSNVEWNSDQDRSDQDLPENVLHFLRLKNGDRIILGHININSIRNKIGLLGDMIKDKIDILLVSETKINSSFPLVYLFLLNFLMNQRKRFTGEK